MNIWFDEDERVLSFATRVYSRGSGGVGSCSWGARPPPLGSASTFHWFHPVRLLLPREMPADGLRVLPVVHVLPTAYAAGGAFDPSRDGTTVIAVVSHPSGRNHFWNDEGDSARARRFLSLTLRGVELR